MQRAASCKNNKLLGGARFEAVNATPGHTAPHENESDPILARNCAAKDNPRFVWSESDSNTLSYIMQEIIGEKPNFPLVCDVKKGPNRTQLKIGEAASDQEVPETNIVKFGFVTFFISNVVFTSARSRTAEEVLSLMHLKASASGATYGNTLKRRLDSS